MTDDFIPHVTQPWQEISEQVPGDQVLRPVSCRVITAARMNLEGVDKVAVLEFTGNDGDASEPVLRVELSGAAARIIADALHEAADLLPS